MKCKRCGRCCSRGGPTLHVEDRWIWDKGVLGPEHLITLRPGELVRDPFVRTGGGETLRPLEAELLKVRGKGDTWTCLFFQADQAACGIYKDRPLECRELMCWDTSQLAQAAATPRLTRFDLLPADHPLVELARDHQAQVDLVVFGLLAQGYKAGDQQAGEELLEAVHYDQALRQTLLDRGALPGESMDFLFGRPLWRILPQWGMQLQRSAQGYAIVLTDKERI